MALLFPPQQINNCAAGLHQLWARLAAMQRIWAKSRKLWVLGVPWALPSFSSLDLATEPALGMLVRRFKGRQKCNYLWENKAKIPCKPMFNTVFDGLRKSNWQIGLRLVPFATVVPRKFDEILKSAFFMPLTFVFYKQTTQWIKPLSWEALLKDRFMTEM